LSESAIAALSSVNVPRHASLLRLALTNSSFAFCMNNFCTAPYLFVDGMRRELRLILPSLPVHLIADVVIDYDLA